MKVSRPLCALVKLLASAVWIGLLWWLGLDVATTDWAALLRRFVALLKAWRQRPRRPPQITRQII